MYPLHLSPVLADTLDVVVQTMVPATGPWWIIGSAAMVLHGLDLAIADVDLVLAPEDAALVLQEHGRILQSGDGRGPYRSDVFGRIEGGPLAIEVLVGNRGAGRLSRAGEHSLGRSVAYNAASNRLGPGDGVRSFSA
jgi:hypothetical protein